MTTILFSVPPTRFSFSNLLCKNERLQRIQKKQYTNVAAQVLFCNIYPALAKDVVLSFGRIVEACLHISVFLFIFSFLGSCSLCGV